MKANPDNTKGNKSDIVLKWIDVDSSIHFYAESVFGFLCFFNGRAHEGPAQDRAVY